MTENPERPEWPAADAAKRCPCLSGEVYGACCGPFHAGDALAPTAERLMRSRYSAYVLGKAEYLLASWHPRTRPASLELDAAQRWLGLEILGRTRGGLGDSIGTVEFIARYRDGRSVGEQHENSSFVRESGRWLYLDEA